MKLKDHLALIDDPRRNIICKIYKDYEDLFHLNPGSSYNHQTWKGGLADHLSDMLFLCNYEYFFLESLVRQRKEKLPFTKGSAEIVIFCHDAEKLITHAPKTDYRYLEYYEKTYFSTKEELKIRILEDWQEKYHLELTDDEYRAIKYTHGEGDDYRNDKRVMNELAAFVGNIDRTSARILYNSGKDLG